MSELRLKKAIRTRQALAAALLAALERQSLDQISVKGLCRAAEVSEATFFNYFPRKQDVVRYLARLWLLELAWYAGRAAAQRDGLSVIEAVFRQTAARCVARPGLMKALIGWLAAGGDLSAREPMPALEKRLALPDLDGIDALQPRGLDAVLLAPLEAAVAAGELPGNTLIPALLIELLAMLFGVPLVLLGTDARRIGLAYQQQLQVIWAGRRALAGAV